MSLSRRNFMKSGAVAAVAAVAAGFMLESPIIALAQEKTQSGRLMGYFQIPEEVRQNTLLSYKRSTFEPYVGDIFTSRDARSRIIQLKLVRVSEYRPNPSARLTRTKTPIETDCFSLLFRASRELPPFSSIYTIHHGALGKFDLFMVRSNNGRQIFYQAVVNHLA